MKDGLSNIKNKIMTTLEIIIAHYEELSLEGSNQAYVVAKYLTKYLADEKAQLEFEYGRGYNEAMNKVAKYL